jgi:hypothetical protein
MNANKAQATGILRQERARQALLSVTLLVLTFRRKRQQAAALQNGLGVDASCEQERSDCGPLSQRRPAEASRQDGKTFDGVGGIVASGWR